MSFANTEKFLTYSIILIGIVIAAAISPHDSYYFFWANLGGFWLPQAAIIGLLILCRARHAIIGSTALIMTIYLMLYFLWITESMAWLGYYFSMPGILIGALSSYFLLKHNSTKPTLSIFFISSGMVLLGLFLNQIIVCNTIMYCGL